MGVRGSESYAFRWGKMGDFFKRLNRNNHSSWQDGAFFTVLLLASKALRAGCWTHSTHSPYPLGRFFCVHVLIFALLLFSWQFVCVFGPGGWESISPFPAKDGPAQGQLRKSYQVRPYTKPHTSAWVFRCLEIQMPPEQCTCLKAQAVWGWYSREVSSYSPSPSPSCFLVLQDWFHLRSSCLCCSLITLNFLGGERHVISWRLILVYTVWKFPLIFVIFKMFLFVGESDFPSFLLSLTAFSDAIPRKNIPCENSSLCL